MPSPPTLSNQNRAGAMAVNSALLAIALLFTWYFSRWTYETYVLGDLYHYRRFWHATRFLPFDQIMTIQKAETGSVEPLYGLFAWTLSSFEHDVILSVVNMVFIGCLLALLRRHGVPALVLPLYLTNFYLIVLLGPAERLKLAILFVMLALLTSGVKRVTLFITTPFIHLQSFLLLLPLGANIVLPENSENSRATPVSRLAKAVAGAIFLGAILLILADALLVKATSYSESGQGGAWQSFVALGIAVVFLRDQRAFVLALTFSCVAALILGGARVNMVSVIILISMFVRAGKSTHPALLVLLVYLSGKGLLFISTYSKYGDGWPNAG